MIRIKRIYDPPKKKDGFRLLVDGLWPRGLPKEKAHVDLWLREIAPSNGLRKWFCHDAAKWAEFQRRYRKELKDKEELLNRIRQLERDNTPVTLLYATKEERYNNAVALKRILQLR